MTTHPTVIVGVGQAGIRVMSKMDEVVKENNDEGRFKYIAMDSDPNTIDVAPEGTTEIPLKYDEAFKDVDIKHYPYLTEDMNVGGTGAERQRPVGRYKLDSTGDQGYDDALDTLRNEIGDHYREYKNNLDENTASFNIIHIHSLGGGTGSGTFPLLTAMLSETKDRLQANDNVVYHAGVGVAPEITFPPEVNVPPGEPDYYPNAYASYNDLEKFTSLHGEGELFLPTYARTFEDGSFHVSDYEVETNSYDLPTVPFDDYWLVGVKEDKLNGRIVSDARDETYREMKNQTIARAVHAISKKQESAENWASGEAFTGTFAQAEISVPHEDVLEFVELRQKRDNKKHKKEEKIPELIEDLEGRIAELRELKKNLTTEQVDDDELDEKIDTWLDNNRYSSGDYIIRNKKPEEIRNDLDTLEDNYRSVESKEDDDESEERPIEEVIEQEDEYRDDAIEALIIATEEILEVLKEETAAPKEEQQWETTVENLWTKYQLDNPSVGKKWGASGIRTVEGKVTLLKEIFEEKIEDYTEVIEAWEADEEPPENVIQRLRDTIPPFIGLFKSERQKAEAAVEELREDKSELESAKNDWEKVEELIGAVDQRRTDLREDIDDKMAGCNTNITNLQNRQDELQKEITKLQSEIDELRKELTTELTSSRLAKLPLIEEKLDELDVTTVEERLTSLSAYVENGFISEEKYERALTDRLDGSWDQDIVDRDFDRPDVSRDDREFEQSNEFWYLFHEDNEDFQNYVDHDPPADVEQFAQAEGDGPLRYLDDPYRIEYVSYTRRGPVAAFEVYQDYQRLKNEGTLDSLAVQYTDHRQAFAYMEWYPAGIQAAFDTRKPVTLSRPPELTVDHINKPELDEDEIEDKLIGHSNWLDSYLWQGFDHERYDADVEYDDKQEADVFQGWKERLEKEEVEWSDFSGSTPNKSDKGEWIKQGFKGWDELLEEYAETLTEEFETIDINIKDEKE